MRQYRIVSNGEKFRVQSRQRMGWRWFGLWEPWGDLGYGWPPITATFDSYQDAEGAMNKTRDVDERLDRPWVPV